jgi:hypothetical protein
MTIASLLRKKWLLAVIAAAVVGSAAYAFAATLNVSSKSLGAGNVTVTSCTSSVTASYTNAYDSALTGGQFAVNTVSLKFADSTCVAGDKIEGLLIGASNTALASFVYTVGSSDTLAGKTVTVTAASLTPSGDGVGTPTGGGTLAAGPDGSDFTSSTVATSGSGAIPAANVTGVVVSAAGTA